jgi:Family of unknown function (DUF6114)
MSQTAEHAGPGGLLTTAGSAWRAFTSWRRRRPFWAGLFLIVAGAELLLIPLPMHSMGLILHIGTGGVLGILIGTILIICALLMWFNPAQRIFYSIVAVLLAIAALVASNLGGFMIGTLLGVIGGSLGFAWAPGTPGAAAGGRRRWRPSPDSEPDEDADAPAAVQGPDQGGNAGTVLRSLVALPVVLAGLTGLAHPANGTIELTAALQRAAPATATAPSLCIPVLPSLPIINQCPSPSPSPSPSDSPSSSKDPCPSPSPGISLPLLSGSNDSSDDSSSGDSSSGSSASGASPSPSCSPAPSPSISLPLPGLSPAPTPSTDPSPSASAGASTTPRARTGAAPAFAVATTPSQLSASSATITGFAYDGTATVRTAKGPEKMLQFTMTSLKLTDVTLTASQGGAAITTTAPSMSLSGSVLLYATQLSGDLAGVPITVTPSTPLATVLQILAPLTVKVPITMTNVVTDQPYSSGNSMQVSGLKIS